jgi:hypothetical protein
MGVEHVRVEIRALKCVVGRSAQRRKRWGVRGDEGAVGSAWVPVAGKDTLVRDVGGLSGVESEVDSRAGGRAAQ